MNTTLLNEVTAFVWAEADMLDHAEYDTWLNLWAEDGMYIIPIEWDTTDFANTLNYAYDNHAMRAKRVHRLGSGESISTVPYAITVRSPSRLRVIATDGDKVTVRCAQYLEEFKKEKLRHYMADITYDLVRSGDSFKIERKVVRLINSTDALHAIGYIL